MLYCLVYMKLDTDNKIPPKNLEADDMLEIKKWNISVFCYLTPKMYFKYLTFLQTYFVPLWKAR